MTVPFGQLSVTRAVNSRSADAVVSARDAAGELKGLVRAASFWDAGFEQASRISYVSIIAQSKPMQAPKKHDDQ